MDNAFFNMLSLHHQIINNIKHNDYTGREAISLFKGNLQERFGKRLFTQENPGQGINKWIGNKEIRNEYLKKIFANTGTVNQDELDVVYKGFHNYYGNEIGHYMRHNYRIVKFIVNNVADDESEQKKILEETGREPIIGDKRYYFGMLRAQCSNDEFELILINSLYKRLKDICRIYTLVKFRAVKRS